MTENDVSTGDRYRVTYEWTADDLSVNETEVIVEADGREDALRKADELDESPDQYDHAKAERIDP